MSKRTATIEIGRQYTEAGEIETAEAFFRRFLMFLGFGFTAVGCFLLAVAVSLFITLEWFEGMVFVGGAYGGIVLAACALELSKVDPRFHWYHGLVLSLAMPLIVGLLVFFPEAGNAPIESTEPSAVGSSSLPSVGFADERPTP